MYNSAVICHDLSVAAYGLEELVKTLIELGAEVNVINSIEWNPLHEACHRGYAGIAALLIQAGAELQKLCPPFPMAPLPAQYPLAEAARQGNVEVVKLLLKHGADGSITNKSGATALQSVSGPLESVMPIYEYLEKTFAPLGLVIDYAQLKEARNTIAVMLQNLDNPPESGITDL